MDRSACVARRTRLQTDMFFNSLLKQSCQPKDSENVANEEECWVKTTSENDGLSFSARNEEGVQLALPKNGDRDNVANKEGRRKKSSENVGSSFSSRKNEDGIQLPLPNKQQSDAEEKLKIECIDIGSFDSEFEDNENVASNEECRVKTTGKTDGSSFFARNEEGGIQLAQPKKGLSGSKKEEKLQNDSVDTGSLDAELKNNEKVCHLDKPTEDMDEVKERECGIQGGFSVNVGKAHEMDSKKEEFRGKEATKDSGLQFSGRKRKKVEDRGRMKGGWSAQQESRFCAEEGKKKQKTGHRDAGSPIVKPLEKEKLNCSGKQPVSMVGEEDKNRNVPDISDSKEVCEEEKVSTGKIECRVMRKHDDLKGFDILELARNSVSEKEGKTIIDTLLAACEQACEEGTKLPDAKEKPPLKFTFGVDQSEPAEKSGFEQELDELWTDLKFALRSAEMGSTNSPPEAENQGTNKTGTGTNSSTLCGQGKHDRVYDEEIGIKCRICGVVILEIRHVSAPMAKNQYSSNFLGKKNLFPEEDVSMFNGVLLQVEGRSSADLLDSAEGTIWDLIPDIRKTMYAHQKEGFEFIWKNLAGTADLAKLKSMSSIETGGCIISHAPGTGKTRLAMVFLKTYLQVFQDCKPVIIAPASILLTWEEEFRKWNIGVPFYNLNSLDLTENEKKEFLDKSEICRNKSLSKDLIRLVKLFLWSKKTSILGISYSLYEKLAGEKLVTEKGRKRKTRNEIPKRREVVLNKENEELRKALLEMPGLLVLDEGHTPRNQRSRIWKVLSKVHTKNRIILSGTPFQNNFLELYNTLCLARPSFLNMIPARLKKFCQKRWGSVRGMTVEKQFASCSSVDKLDDDDIQELKALMAPFVHVHKGSILQENLRGLRDCVVLLNPPDLQKQLLNNIDCSNSTFDFEHKLVVGSVHPWLLRNCCLSKKEESVMNQIWAEKLKNNPNEGTESACLDVLEKLKLNPNGGAKTRFLVEFLRLTEALNEKVLVFSQFNGPLAFIIDQLKSVFSWTKGKEILHMHGRLDQKQRQTLINVFNDSNSEAKILLATTRACSEGIHLVGASRVVLLDVVWNPSVERQAISRAYRLGQKRVVYTYHLMISGTPESDKYCKQALKDRISELVFSSTKENDVRRNSGVAFEDRVLDEMVSHAKLKGMFERIIYQPKESDLVESFT